MNIKLAENIKTLRKERRMTQEQLAEALGVTVGAVYKWERNMSTPDISLILEMADLFQVSTDMLLGYQWRAGNAGALLRRIKELTNQKDYDKGTIEAEKALKKYPNSFDIVYHCALLYLAKGEAASRRKALVQAIELLDHACDLLPQNQDEAISEVSIRTQIAKAHLLLGNAEEALFILKKYNACGVNNAAIGMVLGDYFHNADEAEQYLGKAFRSYLDDINDIMVGYANVFFQRKDYDGAINSFLWLRRTLRGIQPVHELTYFDKYDCVLLETIAECYCCMGEFEQARQYLKAALEKAVQYDRAAPDGIQDMQFLRTMHLDDLPTYDAYGKTAMDCLQRRMEPNDDGVPRLWALWQELKKEAMEQ